jgi:hypothetical protein
MSNWELNKELSNLNKDKKNNEEELNRKKEQMANLLLNDLGKDIDNVLSGQVKVKLSFFEKLKYKFKYYIDKLFNIL